MLTSLVLQFTPATEASLPRDLGRASHALLLRLLSSHDAALAKALHESDQLKPFTCSNVFGGKRQGGSLRVAPDDALWLRYSGLREDISTVLNKIAAQPPNEIEVDGVTFRVTAATLDSAQHRAAGSAGYDALASPYLLARERAEPRLALKFVSPTAFRARGQNLPLPLPGSVFGGLADKWNAFAPIALPEEVRRFADECLAVSQFRGRTRMLRGKDGGKQIGFVGEVAFTATNRDRYWLSLINLLADYAWYAGVGYGTTQGMGQVRRLSLDSVA